MYGTTVKKKILSVLKLLNYNGGSCMRAERKRPLTKNLMPTSTAQGACLDATFTAPQRHAEADRQH
jgi:hypothetical protein